MLFAFRSPQQLTAGTAFVPSVVGLLLVILGSIAESSGGIVLMVVGAGMAAYGIIRAIVTGFVHLAVVVLAVIDLFREVFGSRNRLE